jgi:hypothetical protein
MIRVAPGFAEAVQGWAAKAEADLREVLRRGTSKVAADVVNLTPVDTGRLVGNWEASRGSTSAPFDAGRFDPTKAEVLARLVSVIGTAELGETVYVLNATPYGPHVEYGTGKTPPRAMVRNAVAGAPARFAEAAAEVRGRT